MSETAPEGRARSRGLGGRTRRVLTCCRLIPAFLALALLGGCRGQAASPKDVLARLPAPQGWTRGEVRLYDRNNLYDLVDGLADATFVYGFEQVAVSRCQGPLEAVLELAVWQLHTPADAYGLFTANRAGEPAAIGNEGDTDVGRRLAFWQDRYFVQVWARQAVPDADMWALARAVAKGLPEGGKRPALVDRLPPQGLDERKALFFHEELSIQSQLWLGGENLLGLGPETDGILAPYTAGGAAAQLLLVQYPTPDAARKALGVLVDGGPSPRIEGCAVARTEGPLLGAVFGQLDPAAAGALLDQALAGA